VASGSCATLGATVHMRVIGLTGGIACGKTTVVSYLQDLGYPGGLRRLAGLLVDA
jgi:hypothetical protein